MGKSITAKLNKKRLKETLRRRQAARAVTQLMDHSVPTDVRFEGISFAKSRHGKPAVRVADAHALSPYVIHLNAHVPTPNELLGAPAAAPNLLVPERYLLSLTDAAQLNPSDDLSLTATDVFGQIAEDLALPNGPRVATGKPEATVRKIDHPFFLRAQFVPQPFLPPKPPENFATYFELPEFDEREDAVEADAPEPLFALDLDLEEEETPREPARKSIWRSLLDREHADDERLTFGILPIGWHRAVGAFVLVAFLFVLPFHAVTFATDLLRTRSGLEQTSQTALSQLKAGADAVLVRDAAAASASFGNADDAFSQAQRSVQNLGAITSLLLSAVPATGDTYRAGTRLLEAGKSLSSAGERIAQGFLAAQNELNPTPVSRLTLLTTYVSSALPDLRHASELVAAIDANDLPDAHRDAFDQLAEQLPSLVTTVEEFVSFSDMANTVLGGDGTKRYLVVFQNNAELRATGGFMGSFAELSVKDGVITEMNIPGGGTYDLQGSLKTNLAAPEPLQLLTPRWEFQDANWFPDFPTSARQMMDFYADAGGGTVDGVISVNATYVADLISLLGPIDMPEYGRVIDGNNFLAETQKIVEQEYDREENKPKAFIGDLAPRLLDKVMGGDAEEFFSVLDRVNTGLQSRDIQLYFADGDLERQVRGLGWGGELEQTDGDYLMLVDTNLGGGKTDTVISEDVGVSVSIDPSGTITNTVTVTRTHNGESGDTFTGQNNVDYVRLYVPKGSTLVSASGFTPPSTSLFEIPPDDWKIDDDLLYSMDSLTVHDESGTASYDESGKTVFGNWVQTKPGTSSAFSFTYTLPFTLFDHPDGSLRALAKKVLGVPSTENYSLTVQAQSGVPQRTTHVHVQIPDDWQVAWSSHDPDQAEFDGTTDGFLGILFERGL